MPANRDTEGEGNHSLPQILESAHSATCQKHIQTFITNSFTNTTSSYRGCCHGNLQEKVGVTDGGGEREAVKEKADN